MKRDLRQLGHYLWDGLWFIPGLLALVGLASGLALSGFLGFEYHGLLTAKENGFGVSLVVNVLVGLAGGLITVAGVVFSMTMVVLSSTSAQLGPRLLGDFLRRMTTKLAVGGFLAAFLFQVLIATGLTMGKPVSALVVLTSIFSSLFTFCLLLVFIHLVARFVRVPFLINDVANRLQRALVDFRKMGSKPNSLEEPVLHSDSSGQPVHADKAGYIQVVEAQEVISLATKKGWLVQFLRRAGDFVAEGDPIALVYGSQAGDDLNERVNGMVSLGSERTAQQDVCFALHQLVEISTKALSPGINDPWTAVTVIDRIEGVLAPLADQPLPAGLWYGDDGQLRLAIPVPRVADILGTAYHSIRQFGYQLPPVALALVRSYGRIAERNLHPDFAVSLSHHLKALREDVARAEWNSADQKAFQEDFQAASKSLQQKLSK